ncbi:unnamed protein product [Adineta ricciae]|uniref:Peroxisome assembly protein 12 n=1 Tax=Adineta ricciae TaxID=249248 RepID=A0A814UIQ0_ADIRI|nr:unnamed protein product [Adineta ricciae]
MSSLNSSYSLDFTSPTSDLLPILPSTSELLAQERFTNLVRPCFQHLFKFLQRIHPLSNLLKHLYQYKDEFILIIESILQWFYLHFHSALIGEHFYGLKRTANHRLRSLIFSVFLPYVKLKLHAFQHQMRENNADQHAKYFIILQLLPKLQVFIEGVCWLYRIGYAFGLTKYYSPTLQLARVKLTYAKDPSPNVNTTPSSASQFISRISQIISYGLFVLQLIDWWNSTCRSKQNSSENLVELVSPITNKLGNKRQCPLCRQPCDIPTVILGSGYVYCHQCISAYVNQYHRCPTSHQPVTTEHLIKIY